jgi:ubiquinone/menaquinone biosynthesis C-methylase UbiE
MLPPDFAAFSFHLDPAGSDDSLADRTIAAAGASRIAVMGAGRWNLLVALAARGARVVAFDPSRLTLRTARDAAEIAKVADRVTFFAADPRDVAIPEGVDGALVPSFSWRVLLTREAQQQALECLFRAISPGGALCVDVDRLPPASPAETERTLLRRGPGGQTWWWRRDPARSLVTLSCDAPNTGTIEVALSDSTPESAADLMRAAGFVVAPPSASSTERAFLVGRVPRR